MKQLPAALIASLLLGACGAQTKTPTSSAPDTSNTSMSFSQKREKLLTYRKADEICQSDSGNCMAWTNLALHCERQLAGEVTDYHKPCTAAEEFRERVTGIDLSSAPNAYVF